ncbi:type III secretion specific chlamydia chaperone 2 [Waddlia chondrophila 2032/99]|uniref:Type III secretion specific chlamydia chaperone 2 n=1 Tax=Waddlia chondrophila 2032/99 TaxID=765953 RepID=F8LF01_9BACT|nr:type III secretion specific chlamydia chaperone 2 [Waddlia chondrophila 2032/99]
MKGEQKEQAKKAIESLGTGVGKSSGKGISKLSKDALMQQMLPKNALGLSDAMVEGLYSQAYRLYNTGKYKDASQLFRLLIMIDSSEAKFSMGLAACFHMMKEYSNAISTYSLCGIIDPGSPIPHYHASDCYIQMKDFLSAIISLEMAIKRAGEKPEYQSLKDRALMTIESLKKEAEKLSGELPESVKNSPLAKFAKEPKKKIN